MGSFTTQPSGAQAVYHPIRYVFSHESTLPIESVSCLIEVKDGALTPTTFYFNVRVPYTSKTLVTGSTYRYVFNIDTSAFSKQKLPPFTYQVSSAFRFSVVNYVNIDNPDFWVETRIKCTPEYRNSQGQLVNDTGDATSNWVVVLPAAYRKTDTKNLTAYTNNTGGYNKFLTKRPSGSVWCTNTEASLSLYNSLYKTVSGTDIIFYWEDLDNSANYLSTAVYKYNNGQVTIPLNSILSAISSSIKRIKVSMLRGVSGVYTRFSEEYQILLDRNCCTGVQFSWLNELGGVDNYSFAGEAETEFSVKNEFGQQYDDGITTRLKANYKTSSEIGEVIQVRDLLPATDVDWIKYILASHEVYVKIGSAWYNCVILDGATITESNMLGMFDFSFSARLSDVVSNHN